MNIITNPDKSSLQSLTKRVLLNNEGLTEKIQSVLSKVKIKGDTAIKEYTKQFDGVVLDSLLVSNEELIEAENLVENCLKEAIKLAQSNILKFHTSQISEESIVGEKVFL